MHYFTRLLTGQVPSDSDDNNPIADNEQVLFTSVALVTLYSHPDRHLLQESSGTVVSCTKLSEQGLVVIDISCIQAVVAMIPHKFSPDSESTYFLVEKTGMELARFGMEEEDDEDDTE